MTNLIGPQTNPTAIRYRIPGASNLDTQRHTLRLIGRAIRAGSKYLPLRNHAAAIATTAKPKDYLGQAQAIYDDIVKRWRYVRDPWRQELITFDPKQLYSMVLGADGVGVGRGKGAGDCDCVSALAGSLLRSVGFPVRLAVTSPPQHPPGPTFAHVFVQAQIPKLGWVSFDPVVYPKHGMGYTTPHSRMAIFNLDGQLVAKRGNVVGLSGIEEEEPMSQYSQYGGTIPDLTQWKDYGLGGVEDYSGAPYMEDFRKIATPQFGMLAEYMGIIDGCGLGLAVEATPEYHDGQVLARTPLLELAPGDYQYVSVMRRPYDGMMALGDDGQVYEYDGGLGFFKKLFRRVKKRVKRVAKRIRKGIRKVIRKIPGGKFLMKLGGKIFTVAKKLIKPLMKYVGPLAKKLAPVAALIPGWGPAIAAGLYATGRIADIMKKTGAVIKTVKGVARLKFPSGSAAHKMTGLLNQAAYLERKRQAAGGKIKIKGAKRRRRRKPKRISPKLAAMMRRKWGGGRRTSRRY